jgi:predicted PurR-regulated permease PerM
MSSARTLQRVRDQLLIAMALAALLYFGRAVLIPLAYGLLTAMVLYPSVARLERRGVARPVAIFIGLLVLMVLFGALVGLLFWEMSSFVKELPGLGDDARAGISTLRHWISTRLGLSPSEQDVWTARLLDRLPDSIGNFFLRSADNVAVLLFDLCIIPVFAALLLYSRHHFLQALTALTSADLRPRIPSIAQRSVHRFSAFIVGMMKVYAIVGALNSIGLLLLGVPNAILFGMLTALMTIIPYIGIIISSLLPITLGYMATGNIWVPIGVIAVFGAVQYLEANIIFPKVVGTELGLNTLSSIVLVLAGALLWGVSGMILFLPFVSILMLVSEDVPEWKPLKLLLGKRGRSKG